MRRLNGPAKVCLLVILMMLTVTGKAFAQSYTVQAVLSDGKTEEPVAFATVYVTLKGEKSPSKYALSDEKGAVKLTGVKKGVYILKAELIGYKAFEKEIDVSKTLDLGTLKMDQDAEVIDAAVITAVGNPIIVKKDTMEYNAASFKTSDNDMLEELLKKLPGVEIGTDGSITANGETISKIMIDGKEFFLDDPQLATKNIPAKIIEKVKVVEKKSDQAEFTGIDDGEEETVIDLSIKPGMFGGWFGNAMLGGGHDVRGAEGAGSDWRFQGAGMAARLTEDSQLSIILNGNNTNNRGFNDLAGSMMQTMRGAGRGMGRGMGGWTGNGITTSWMGGLNGNFNLLDDKMELNGNYLYNGSNKYIEESSLRNTYMDDGSTLIYDNDGYNITNSNGHRLGVRLEHAFSENTSIIFEPRFNIGGGNFTEYSDFLTMNEMDGLRDTVNTGFNENTGVNSNWRANGWLLLRQKLGKPGRTLSLFVRYEFSNNTLDGFNQSLTDVTGESMEIVNQRYEQRSTNSALSGRVTYTEPLGRNLFLEANYSYSWSLSKSLKNSYNSATNEFTDGNSHLLYNPDGETFDNIYSNNITNRYTNQRGGLNLMYQKSKIRAQIGAAAHPTNTYNLTNGEVYENKVVNWAPQASFRYDFTDNSQLRMDYFGYSSQPSTSQLMPVPDNSDPLNVSLGNPHLLPYFNHNIRSRFGYTNKKNFFTIHGRFGGGFVQNPIVNAIWYDASGAQYSIPVNGPMSGSVDGRVIINSPLDKDKHFYVFSMSFARYNESSSYIGTGNLVTEDYYNAETAEFDYDKFNDDFMRNDELGLFSRNDTRTVNFTQRLRLTYRNEFIEMNLGGRTRYSQSWYTVANANNTATWNNQIDASVNWTIPGGINLISDLDYNWYRGYTTPQDDEFIFNAEITKLLFKNKFTLAVKAYDIFNQSKNLSVTDESNYHLETRNNTLGRYIMVSLTYRFGDFGNAGGRRGPGGPGGPGGPPPPRR